MFIRSLVFIFVDRKKIRDLESFIIFLYLIFLDDYDGLIESSKEKEDKDLLVNFIINLLVVVDKLD